MSTLADIQNRICEAHAHKAALNIQGGNSKAFLGSVLQGETLHVSTHCGIVSYEPTELVVTARCGTLLSELEATLAEKLQCLAFEPPHFANTATVGGMVATGLAGPSRAFVGGVRDYVLGAQMINGKGELLSFGGQVMKNVAGYDVSRVLAGSFGILGVITEVSLKVLPIAPATLTLRFEMQEAEAIKALNTWAGKPLPLNASCWQQGVLHLRLRGAEPALKAARATLGGELLADADAAALWQSLREQTHTHFKLDAAQALWRVSVPATTEPLNVGDSLIEWAGGQRWLVMQTHDEVSAKRLRELAAKAGGHAQCFRYADSVATKARQAQMYAPLSPALDTLHQRLKDAFDPHRIFNRGRMFASL